VKKPIIEKGAGWERAGSGKEHFWRGQKTKSDGIENEQLERDMKQHVHIGVLTNEYAAKD
jgi:hypothetical protein